LIADATSAHSDADDIDYADAITPLISPAAAITADYFSPPCHDTCAERHFTAADISMAFIAIYSYACIFITPHALPPFIAPPLLPLFSFH
jgi:hypothetical protein